MNWQRRIFVPPGSPYFYQPIRLHVKNKCLCLCSASLSGSEKAIQVQRYQQLLLVQSSPVSCSLAIPDEYKSPQVCAIFAKPTQMS